ncbi:acetoin utilization transport system permease protein [Ornithinibacillus halophilus]|uniref:Acetoin utilization transport system permease protein n=2 Tax=Ornithinibacillus halophilus TaxID=930117 RepID=A0A1M5KQ61_9BACI|nr:acetoin utilization transport system permease protein [Ornithinibacillus halophilus]
MNFKDKVRFIRQNIKKTRVRTFMTVLATAMGCSFLIVLASVGYGLQESIVQDALEQQIVTQIDVYGHEDENGNYRPLTLDDIELFDSTEGVKAITRRNQIRQVPTFALDEYKAEVMAVSADFPSEAESGMELSDGRMPENKNEVIVGYHFLNYLSVATEEDILDEETGKIKDEYLYQEEIIGKELEMVVTREVDNDVATETISLTVVGILEQPTKEWVSDANVYISEEIYREVEVFTGTPGGELGVNPDDVENKHMQNFEQVKIYATNLENVQPIVDMLDEENYATYSVVNEMKQINMLFTVAKAGLILVGTIAVIIASIGIYNTMTMAVTERAPDIGIMKAIGANPKTIKQIFVMESSYIGLLGAIIGTVVAYLISYLVNLGLPIIIESVFEEELPEGLLFSYIPVSLVVISVGICLLVTILSGMRPAKKATQIDVLQAMRREM